MDLGKSKSRMGHTHRHNDVCRKGEKKSNIDGVRREELHEACTESKRPSRGNVEVSHLH